MMTLPKTMKALLQKHDGYAAKPSPFALEAAAPYVELAEVPVPQPAEGQVLLKLSLASVNPSDVMFIKGLYGQPRQMGKAAGFEGVGVVVASGGGKLADGLVGKRVSYAAGPNGTGSWAEYAVADAAGCIPLIDGVSDVDGAAMIVNPLTAIAMFEIVRDEGEKAFVLTAGASQLCKLIMGLAREEGFRPIAIVRRDDQIAPLLASGAAHVLNATAPDYEEKLQAVMREEKPRILLDAVTGPQAAHLFHVMPRRARWIIYGRLDAALPSIEEPGQMIFMHKKIEGFWLTEWMRTAGQEARFNAIMRAQKNFADGTWKTDVTARVPLERAVEELAGELAKPNGKVFLVP